MAFKRLLRPPAVAAAAVAVVVAIAAVVFVVSRGDDGGNVGTGPVPSTTQATPPKPTPTPTRTSPAKPAPTKSSPSTPAPTKPTPTKPPRAGTWTKLPAVSVPAGFWGAGVWTGKEFIVFDAVYPSGTTGRSVGVAYNPTTRTWRTLPPTLDPPEMREGLQVALWTGKEMLTWGQVDEAYNPRTNTWRRLPPGWNAPAVTVWTGRLAVLWGGGCCGVTERAGVVIDPVSGTRQRMPDAPFGGEAGGVWTGRELIVVKGWVDSTHRGQAAAYNLATRSWRTLAPLPRPTSGATVTWTGREVLVLGGTDPYTEKMYADGMAYNPATNRWRRLPAMGFPRAQHLAVWTGKLLLVWGGVTVGTRTGGYGTPPHGFAYDPARNRWTALPKAPLAGRSEAVAVWTGRSMIVWGGTRVAPPYSGRLHDGAAYRP